MDVTIYRPGPLLALSTLMTPVLVALAGALVALNTTGAIPVWLPFILLLWVPLTPVLWLTLKSVRLGVHSIGVARPWERWRELDWSEIALAEGYLGGIRVVSTTGMAITFMPRLLRSGARLERALLLRLPSHALTGTLRRRAQRLIVGDIYPTPTGGLAGLLRARPLRRWRIGVSLLAAAGMAGLVASVRQLPGVGGIAAAALAAIITDVSLVALIWLSQSVSVSEHSVEVALPFRARVHSIRWQEVELVEVTGNERLLRLRGDDRRLFCPGPGLLSVADRNAMRAFLHEYCLARNVPVVHRRWML
jgi:hypothetical protein